MSAQYPIAQREKITFSPNDTHVLTIASEPKESLGRSGETQMQYIFQGHKIAWVEMQLHDAISAALDLGEGMGYAGHTLTITKRTGRTNGKQSAWWEVIEGQHQPAQPTAPAAAATVARPATAPATRQRPIEVIAPRSTEVNVDHSAAIAKASLWAAYTIWLELSSYAETKGQSIRPGAGDLRALAATIMIHATESDSSKAAA